MRTSARGHAAVTWKLQAGQHRPTRSPHAERPDRRACVLRNIGPPPHRSQVYDCIFYNICILHLAFILLRCHR